MVPYISTVRIQFTASFYISLYKLSFSLRYTHVFDECSSVDMQTSEKFKPYFCELHALSFPWYPINLLSIEFVPWKLWALANQIHSIIKHPYNSPIRLCIKTQRIILCTWTMMFICSASHQNSRHFIEFIEKWKKYLYKLFSSFQSFYKELCLSPMLVSAYIELLHRFLYEPFMTSQQAEWKSRKRRIYHNIESCCTKSWKKKKKKKSFTKAY